MSIRLSLLICTICILASCSTQSYLPKQKDSAFAPYGAKLTIKTKEGVKHRGELLAIDSSKVYLMAYDRQGNRMGSVYIEDIATTKVRFLKSNTPIYLGAGLGTAFSASLMSINGLLVGLGGLNILNNSLLILQETRIGSLPKGEFDAAALRVHARYPQGLPKGVHWKSIR